MRKLRSDCRLSPTLCIKMNKFDGFDGFEGFFLNKIYLIMNLCIYDYIKLFMYENWGIGEFGKFYCIVIVIV